MFTLDMDGVILAILVVILVYMVCSCRGNLVEGIVGDNPKQVSTTPDSCISKLSEVCEQRKSAGACFTCIGQNQHIMREAGCMQRDFTEYCAGEDESPKFGFNVDSSAAVNFKLTNYNGGNWYESPSGIMETQGDSRIKMVRLFASDCPGSVCWRDVIDYCMKNEIYVFLGIYVRQQGGPDGVQSIQNRINTLSEMYKANREKFDKYVIAISVGNECEPDGDNCNRNIKEGISYCRDLISQQSLPDVLLTTTLNNTRLISDNSDYLRADVIKLLTEKDDKGRDYLDFISFNPYPYWAGVSITDAITTFKGMISKTRKALAARPEYGDAKEKQLWVAETGWEHGGPHGGRGHPEDLKNYYRDIIELCKEDTFTYEGETVKTPDKVFLYSLKDAGIESFGIDPAFNSP